MATSMVQMSASGSVANVQPASPGLWNDGGVLTYWNGVDNVPVDVNDGSANDSDNWMNVSW